MRLSTAVVLATLTFMEAASAAPASAQTAALGLTSTKPSGAISVQTDPTLSGGRLVMKIAAHNAADKPAQLSNSNVQVFLGDKAVALLTVDQLVTEVQGGPPAERTMNSTQANYDRPAVTTSSSGEPDVSNMTGGGSFSPPAHTRSGSRKATTADPQIEAQVDAIKATILQTLDVPPGKALGAQVISEKLKFSRKDPRVLRVVVTFNGDAHEFEFEAPPAK